MPHYTCIRHTPDIRVYRVPAYNDNYLWIVRHPGGNLLIDPGEAKPIAMALATLDITPDAILVTHKHWDHVTGVDHLAERFAIPVYAPYGIHGCKPTHLLKDNDRLDFGALQLAVIALPGHTLEHVGYVIHDADPPLVFVGDTLFAAGCGRLFEGTPAQMWHSIQRLLRLPDNTVIYCGHEYTRANLRFALTIEPDNQELIARSQHTHSHRQATIPTTLALEKATNPFCRVKELLDKGQWKNMDEAQLFGALRRRKDSF